MWPSPTSLRPTAVAQRQSSAAVPIPAYEPSRHDSSDSGTLDDSANIWQYPCPSDAKTEAKMTALWPRRASGVSPSAWLDDYYNSAVADDDDDDGDDSIFLPVQYQQRQQRRQRQQQQQQQPQPQRIHHRQSSFVQFAPWQPTTLNDATITVGNVQPAPFASRPSRLSHSSASYQPISAQQHVATQMMVLHGEEMLREKLDMYQMQMYQQPQPPQHHERLASFSSDIFPASYPQGQMYEAVPVSSPGQPLMTTPSVTTTMEGMAALTMAEPSTRHLGFSTKEGFSLFPSSYQFPEPLPSPANDGQPAKAQSKQQPLSQTQTRPQQPQPQPQQPQSQQQQTTPSTAPTKTFKPMQMVFREGRRASASSTSTSTSSGTGTGTATTATTADSALGDALLYQQTPVARRMSSVSTSASVTASVSASYCPPSSLCPPPMYNSPSPASAAFSTSLASLTSLSSSLESPLPVDEQVFRRQQGISLNYRGDIHNPHNRGDHVPAHLNTSLFLMGLPPRATVGDLLRAVAALGPTGRVFAASVNPPDPARRLPLAAAKISFFTRPQAERLKAQIDGGQLVMWDSSSGDCSGTFGRSLTIRCAWNRDKKPPRQCVQASECRVLRIRGPADVVNFEALAAYFDEKFRYELQDVKVLGASSSSGAGEQTMEWRFASFQSQAIAAKMALNQERKMVRVEYGRDPCEWGEC